MRRGSALVTVALASPVLFGLCGLAVDFGHVQSAKMQLSGALDAASRYGAVGLSDSTVSAKAIAAAGQNIVDGSALGLTSADISVGHYNATTRTFTVNGTPIDAVRVSVSRTSGRKVTMSVSRAIGIDTIAISGESFACDVNLAGTAASPTGAIKGFAAIGSMSLNGTMTIRAWDSSNNTNLPATAWAAAQTDGAAAINNVTLQGELQAAGAVANNGSTISKGMTGSPGNLSAAYPTPVVPAGATNMGNYNGPAGASQTFGAGTYYFTSFNVPAGKTVNFSGAAKVYVGGNITISGDINTFGSVPNNLQLYNTTGSGVNIGASATPLYSEIYAPTSPLNLSGRTIYGSLIASTMSVSAANIYVDARSTQGGFNTPVYTGPRVVNVLPHTVN